MNATELQMQVEQLSEKVERFAMESAIPGALTPTGIANLSVFTKLENTIFESTLYQPVFCLILQGKKETVVGDKKFSYESGDAIVVSHDLPVVSRITKASPKQPYLALIFHLDLGILRSLVEQFEYRWDVVEEAHSMTVHKAEAPLVDAMHRYFSLVDNPDEAQVLAPLISKEIHFRLLLAPYGSMLRKLLNRDSHASRIDTAIGLIRQQYKQTLSVPNIAQAVGMSASSFHEHFKLVTQTTPLQYQKDLRLMEAKRMLDEGGRSVSSIAYEVGYESPNQFSREYSRKFGVSPLKDTRKPVSAA